MLRIAHLFILFLIIGSCNIHERKEDPVAKVIVPTSSSSTSVKRKISTALATIDPFNGKVKAIHTSTFVAKNQQGKIVKVALGNLYVTSYDTNQKPIQRLYSNSSGKLQTNTMYENDKIGNCIGATVYGPSKKILKTIKFNYDVERNLIEELSYKPTGQLLSKQQYAYDKQGRLLSGIKYLAPQVFDMKTSYAYNAKGDIEVTEFYRSENKLIIECKNTYSTFDKNGNWLVRIERTNKGSTFLVERVIEYYK